MSCQHLLSQSPLVPGNGAPLNIQKQSSTLLLLTIRSHSPGKDKDTGRFIQAGAEEVVWVKSPPQELEDILPLALERLSSLDGIIVEGNSAIEFLQPDIVIFIFGNDKERWKPGIERLVGISDIIVYENESELPEVAKTKRLFFGDRSGIKGVQGFLELISDLIYERKTERRNNEKGC